MRKLAIDGGKPLRNIPFPKRTPYGEEEVALVVEAVRSQNLFGVGGPKVSALEKEFASLYGAKHAVASTSGTAAIHIALGMINPEPGDEIIIASITDAGSVIPVVFQNCIPVFADVDETYNMDPEDVERKITGRTAAIMVVHLFGNACNMNKIQDIANRHGIPLIEDCSQAHATLYNGKYLGVRGDVSVFSLQQSKHMTTGDGGMTITNRDIWAERMFLFRNKGWTQELGRASRRYALLAPNYRKTERQGAVGLPQVRKVRSVVEKRIKLGTYLSELISDIDGVSAPPITKGSEHSYWLYPVRIDHWQVDKFSEALTAEGVVASAGYIGLPIFLCMEALAAKNTFGTSSHPFDGCHGAREIQYCKGMCPRAEKALRHMLTISIIETFHRKDIEDIADAVRKVAELLPRENLIPA